MKALIIAAGQGKRISALGRPKPLILLNNVPILEWILRTLNKAGLDDFVVVLGYRAEDIKPFLREFSKKRGMTIDVLLNEEWEKENGLSVWKARGHLQEKFLLLMSDHIFDAAIAARLKDFPLQNDEVILAVDTRIKDNPLVDLDDVTKVQKRDDKIVEIGKQVKDYNAFDTGIFLCSPALFDALAESMRNGDFSLSGGIKALARAGKARVMDIGDRFWIDVDDEKALKKAEQLISAIAQKRDFP